MEFKRNLVTLVAFFALAVFALSIVSAANVTISDVDVSGIKTLSTYGSGLAVFAGQSLPVRVVFNSNANLSDVRVKAWISGESDYAVSSERFDVLANNVYSRLMTIDAPAKVDPTEALKLEISIESKADGVLATAVVNLGAQRDAYSVDVLDVSMDTKVRAGSNLAVALVLKNTGMHFAEDTFVKASIPALGIERNVYFGDLSPVDQVNPDKEDAAERTLYLSIPSNTPAGIYTVQFEAYNADSSTTVTKKVAVVGASGDSRIVSTASSKSFAVGDKETYSMTLVNSGNEVQVYDISFEAPEGLSLTADESVFAVSAGNSKTIKVEASAVKAGTYNFVMNVESDGNLVKKESFEAKVSSSGIKSGVNATVVLTVVLAIVFIVLLVVLIVLLTRKPQKSEEFGESYY